MTTTLVLAPWFLAPEDGPVTIYNEDNENSGNIVVHEDDDNLLRWYEQPQPQRDDDKNNNNNHNDSNNHDPDHMSTLAKNQESTLGAMVRIRFLVK